MNTHRNGIIAEDLGIAYWPILIPDDSIDLEKWAVIACDQFTSDDGYWKEVKNLVKDAPSTLNCIFPEVFLGQNDQDQITLIQKSMNRYMDNGTLRELPPGCIWTERVLSSGKVRHGLVLAVDLEKYDFRPGSKAHIKATEKTIIERIPPRKRIRENAPIEFPHILVLYSDPDKLIEHHCLGLKKNNRAKELYSTKLMKGGGKISGYFIHEENDLSKLSENFRLLLPKNMDDILFAVGDGNHSLATAKAIWDDKKQNLSKVEVKSHPARFALVEMVNLFDGGLGFEPIHRVIFNTDSEKLVQQLEHTDGIRLTEIDESEIAAFEHASPDSFESVIVTREKTIRVSFTDQQTLLPVGTLQTVIDNLEYNGDLDFIHGFKETIQFGRKPGNIAFLTPPIDPGILFACVREEGVLPRKTFSLGHAEDKRYYLEGKRI